jgi:NADH dehydrogenase, FAD-containing subunit
VKDHPGVFAIGDIAAMTDGKTGQVVPGLGATALQAGRHVGETIKRLLDGKPPKPFEYFNKGMMAQVGRGAAVVELPTGGTMTGHLAWLPGWVCTWPCLMALKKRLASLSIGAGTFSLTNGANASY